MKVGQSLAIWAVLALSAGASAQDVIARMGATEIKLSDLKRLLSEESGGAARANLSVDELDQVVRRELIRSVLVAEAKAKGFEKNHEFLQKLERAREQLLVSAYINSMVKPPADYPSEAELKAAYESNKAMLTSPRQFQLAQIFIALPANTEAATTQKLAQRANDLAAKAAVRGSDFAKLARENSEHKESALKGGDLGWLPETQVVAEIRTALPALQKGAVSGAIKSASGWHIVKLLDSKDAVLRPYEEVKAGLSDALRLRKAQANEQQYLTELLKKAPIVVNQVELSKHAQSAR